MGSEMYPMTKALRSMPETEKQPLQETVGEVLPGMCLFACVLCTARVANVFSWQSMPQTNSNDSLIESNVQRY